MTAGDFANGALYWVIKVDGKVLPKDTAIKDVTNAVGGSAAHYIRGTSLVGVYTGNLGTNSLADYADLDSLIASGLLTALESSNYTVAKDNSSLTLTLNTEISLAQDDSLYLIVKTEPSQLPANKRDAFTYNNKLRSSSDGKTGWTTTRPARPCTAAKISLRNWAVSLPIPVPATPPRTSSPAQNRPSAQTR